MRKIYITLGILSIGIIAMAYLYFSNLRKETNANDLSLNIATANAALLFSFENDKSFYEILNGQDLFQSILGDVKAKQLKSLRDEFSQNAEVGSVIDGQKVYIGFLPNPEDQKEIDFLISTQLKPNSNPQAILAKLNNSKVKTTKIGDLYTLSFKDSTQCFVGVKDLLVVLSNNQKSIQMMLKKSTEVNNGFANYIKNNSRFNKNTLANLYIDFNQIPLLLKNILNTTLNGELNVLNKQNTYAALSYNFSKEQLLFNGSTVINDANSYYKLFDNIAEQKITINNLLPEKTANYTAYTITDYNSWYKALNTWLEKHQERDKINKAITTINQKYGLDLAQLFPKYFKNQLLTFQLNSGEKFGAVALSNGEKVNQFLLDLSSDYAPEIKIFKESGILYAFFGEPFKKFERPFFTIIDNYLVVANNASSIQVFLNSYKNNSLLTSNEDYQNFSNQLSSSATISFYVNHKNSNDIFGRNLKAPYYKQYQKELKKFDVFAYQLSGDKGKFLSNLLLYKKPQQTLAIDTIQTTP